MVEIYIDGERCDVAVGYKLPKNIFTYDGGAMAKASQLQSGRRVELRLPSTPRNDVIMCHAGDPTAEPFNEREHVAVVAVDGGELLRGVVHLLGIEANEGAAEYVVVVRDGAGDWAEQAARTELRETSVDYDVTLSEELVERSWSDDVAVRFLPVRYDDYTAAHSSTSLFPPQRVMTMGDYHPFISVDKLMRAIFSDAGYSVESEFMDSSLFRKLYISGRYATENRSLSKMEEVAGFFAGRESEPTAEADHLGRVYLSPLVLTSSLGNIVESTAGGERYNNNSVLSITDEGVVYRPTVAMTVGFELRLRYKTDYKITSGVGIEGFDALYVDSGCDMRFNLVNQFPDRRNSAAAGVMYRCVIHDFEEGEIYRLLYTSAEGNGILSVFSVGSTYVTIPEGHTNVRCTLQRKIDSETFVEMSDGWSLYDGYVEDEGEVEVDVTLQIPPELITPSGKSFARMYLHGAREGQRVTLLRECTLRPIFTAAVALGSQITFSDIVGRGVSQLEFIEALQQMFNLRIATDPAARKLYIEPYDEFYNGELHDWSERVEREGKILSEELSARHRKWRTLSYRAEQDGAVARYNTQNDTTLGEWSVTSTSYAAVLGRERNANPLFSPTLSQRGIHGSAPSAMIMQVGDRDSDVAGDTVMRIVRYEGLRELPVGEVWSFPSYAQSYPFAAFHAPDEFTLCFENRDGELGLHSYYDNEWQAQQLRRTLEVDVSLAPHELSSLLDFGGEPSVRSRFRLNLSGQRAEYWLEAVVSYDAERSVARCRFVRTMND